MAERISVYVDDNTMRKLEDLKRKLEVGMLAEVSVSRAVSYAIVRAWQSEFADIALSFDDDTRRVVEKYTTRQNGSGVGEVEQ